MKTLILPVKREYFEAIKAGTKTEEYRLANNYWTERLTRGVWDYAREEFTTRPKNFDRLIITLGYPPASDTSRRLEFLWREYEVKTITHPHFGPSPVRVFAIKLEASK